MAKAPPPDDPWTDLIGQIEDAFSEIDLGPDMPRDAILEGVREALRGMGLNPDEHKPRRRGPEVTVVEGGRRADRPSTGERPELRLAPSTEEEPVDDEPTTPGPDGEEEVDETEPSAMRATVRVVRLGRDERIAAPSGTIRVGGDVPTAQVVYTGAGVRAYRITCTRGRLRLHLGDELAAVVFPGQSTDVEAATIRVTGDGGDAEGTYLRL